MAAERNGIETDELYIYAAVRRRDRTIPRWTNDLDRRLKAHNEGKGGKYTRSRRPVRLVYYEEHETKQEAMRREWEIKQLTRAGKEELLQKKNDRKQVTCLRLLLP